MLFGAFDDSEQFFHESTRTSSFGYYRFDDVEAGQTVILNVSSKRFQFTPQVVSVEDNIADLDFTAIP